VFPAMLVNGTKFFYLASLPMGSWAAQGSLELGGVSNEGVFRISGRAQGLVALAASLHQLFRGWPPRR
jgi:hypothetical protein